MTAGGTIIAWIYPRSYGETAGRIIDKSTSSSGADGYMFYIGSGNDLGLRVDGGSITGSSTNDIIMSRWQFVAVTFNSSGRKLYVNGVDRTASGGSETGLPPNIASTIRIGERAAATDRTFDGYIDEIRIYNRTLSNSEILMQYQSEFAKYNSTEYRFYVNVTNLTSGNYTYSGWANDTLGNINSTEVRSLSITTDFVAPVTSASAVKNDSSSYTFGSWTTSPYLNITLSCSDGGVGCDRTVYCTDSTDSCTPTWGFFNSSWPYRQNISYSNTAGNLTNYQVKILLNSSNAGSHWNWSYNGSDVRITYYNSSSGLESEIPFWIESWNSTATNATIWANASFIQNNTSITLYMYYGNFSLTSKSNGNTTFVFFDPFDGASLDQTKWNSAYVTVSNSIVTYAGGTNNGWIKQNTTYYPGVPVNYSLRARMKTLHSGTGYGNNEHFSWIDGTWNNRLTFSGASSTNAPTFQSASGGAQSQNSVSWTADTWVIVEQIRNNTSALGKINDVLVSTITSNVNLAANYLAYGDSGGISSVSLDWVLVRKYASGEPTQSIGVEETLMKVQVSTQGASYIRYRSNDTVGNTETINSQTMLIDSVPPTLVFNSPTDANGPTVARNWGQANITLDEATSGLDTFKFNWNGTNYSIYDLSLFLALNFNNNSVLGENATNAADVSMYGNNGTMGSNSTNSPNWTAAGKYGGAYAFDGVDDLVNCGNSTSLAPTNALTVEAWIKTGMNQTAIGPVSKFTWGDYDYMLYFTGDAIPTVDFYMKDASGTSDSSGGYVFGYNDSQWHHYAATFNGDYIYLYIDGSLRASRNTTLADIRASSKNLNIGYGWNGYFNGSIDEVRIYNRSLNSSEIWLHYQSEFAKYNSSEYRFYVNVTNLTQGNYTYSGWANDTVGNSNSTDGGLLRYLTVGEFGGMGY